MAAPLGNQYAKKERILRRQLLELIDEDPTALRDMCAVVIANARGGDLQSWIAIRDTIDGKPKQSLDVGGDPDNPVITKAVVEFVRPNGSAA